jgi:hypothetical protein
MYNYLKPTLNECKKRDGIWGSTSPTNAFSWTLNDDNGYRYIGSYLYSDHWEIVNDDYKEENVNIKVFIDYVEFIEDSEFNDFDHDFMYGLYMKIKEVVENVTVSNESNNESVIENRPIPESDNKHVYLLTIDACCDISSYVYLIKATNKDEAFEIFWNRYKDFPEADIDEEFGSMVFDDSYYDECCRLHRELYTRTDKTHMIASIEADIIIDGVINVDISDDIVYITEVGM